MQQPRIMNCSGQSSQYHGSGFKHVCTCKFAVLVVTSLVKIVGLERLESPLQNYQSPYTLLLPFITSCILLGYEKSYSKQDPGAIFAINLSSASLARLAKRCFPLYPYLEFMATALVGGAVINVNHTQAGQEASASFKLYLQ